MSNCQISNVFVQQQKQYRKMIRDKFVDFFQICHSTDQPVYKQCRHEATEKREHNEANQENDVAEIKHAATG